MEVFFIFTPDAPVRFCVLALNFLCLQRLPLGFGYVWSLRKETIKQTDALDKA